MNKKTQRIKRSRKFKAKNVNSDKPILTVFRSNTNIYAQIIQRKDKQSSVIASSNSLKLEKITKTESSKVVGKEIAELALKHGVKQVAYDRSGFKYHGRIKVLADAARENGLEF